MTPAPLPCRFRHAAGFSMLELSVVLIIIAMVTSALLSLGTQTTMESRREITLTRMQSIAQALGTYALRHKSLPCPFDGSLRSNDATAANIRYGRASNIPPVTAGNYSDACPNTTLVGGISIGALPFISLQLGDEYLVDGWNRRFTYAVDMDFTTPRSWSGSNVVRGDMEDTDADPNDMNLNASIAITQGTATTNVLALILSHGPNGHGAWPANGGTRINRGAAVTSPNEWQNAGTLPTTFTHDANFVQAAEDTDTPTAADYYDDLLLGLTRDRLITLAGGIVDRPTCDMLRAANAELDETATPQEGPIGCTASIGSTAPDNSCLLRQFSLSESLIELCFIFYGN